MVEETIAYALASGRKNKTRSAPALPKELTEADAYILQEKAIIAYESRKIGYKIGATSPEAQKIIGCDGPFFGPMFEADLIAPGATLPVDETNLGLECEFAFQMSRTFPQAGDVLTVEGIGDAIARCVPAIEIVGTRIAGSGFPSAIECIADYGLNSGFCPGVEIVGWREQDLAATIVTAEIDGIEVNRGVGKNVYGHPLAALVWLAQAFEKRGERLEAGEWVSTGTCLGVVQMKKQSTITARYGESHKLTLTLE